MSGDCRDSPRHFLLFLVRCHLVPLRSRHGCASDHVMNRASGRVSARASGRVSARASGRVSPRASDNWNDHVSGHLLQRQNYCRFWVLPAQRGLRDAALFSRCSMGRRREMEANFRSLQRVPVFKAKCRGVLLAESTRSRRHSHICKSCVSSAAVFSEREHTTDNADDDEDDEDDDGTMTATKHQRSVCIGRNPRRRDSLRCDSLASTPAPRQQVGTSIVAQPEQTNRQPPKTDKNQRNSGTLSAFADGRRPTTDDGGRQSFKCAVGELAD